MFSGLFDVANILFYIMLAVSVELIFRNLIAAIVSIVLILLVNIFIAPIIVAEAALFFAMVVGGGCIIAGHIRDDDTGIWGIILAFFLCLLNLIAVLN